MKLGSVRVGVRVDYTVEGSAALHSFACGSFRHEVGHATRHELGNGGNKLVVGGLPALSMHPRLGS